MVVVLKSDEAKHLHVPHYKTLTIKTILEYASAKDEVSPYLCDDIDIPKLPRSFVCNLVFSICGDDFRLWVSQRVKQRNDKVAENQNLTLELDPEIANAFNNSVNISSRYSLNTIDLYLR